MIEIVKEGTENERKREIPKNVRQMGEVRGNVRIYMEDYITTFMKQISTRDDRPKAMVLYGTRQTEGELSCYFVNGAILAEAQDEELLGESAWKEINEKAGYYFKDLVVLGWIYIRYDLADFIGDRVLKIQQNCFRQEQNLYMEYSVGERQEKIYLFQKDAFIKQPGYFVYYEKNEAMQNYMITIKQDEPEEIKPEVDRAAKKFRGIVAEKKEELHHRQTMGMLYGTSVAMLLIVTVIGVTMLNNYEKMQNMEKVLYEISSQVVERQMEEPDLLSENEPVKKPKEIEGQKSALQTSLDQPNGQAAVIADPASALEELEKERDADIPLAETLSGTSPGISGNTMEQPTNEGKEHSADEGKEHSADETDKLPAEGDNVQPAEAAVTIPTSYCIQKGDTLAGISRRFYGNETMIKQICERNNIENQDAIQYGYNIILP